MASQIKITEQETSRTVLAGDMNVHYHDVGSGDPLLLLHSYGPGTTGWITFHKILPALSQRYRCIVMDLPNFGRTGPVTYNEPLHNLQARTALALMDALGIEKAHLIGSSQGGQSAMVLAMEHPERVNKLVFGSCHIKTGGDLYLMGNRPSEGNRVTNEVLADPTRENVRRYLRVHIDEEELVTEELVDYIHQNYTSHPDHIAANAASVSVPYDHGAGLPSITAPSLIIWGRYDRMCVFEIGIAALNNITDSRMVLLNNCGHWPPYEKPEEYTAHLLNFLENI
ncbi:MAG: alpha/beta hydrolase [Chloroflexi bacterium]|nr:alpha/beta hydrolase [Chloroflexota bacterium]MDP6497129.1 alpha/beta fold hydrolase [Dehalococcoidia bacterium]MQG56236.1 alpha/beta fold hydrolase [SAR202 cluster bacterium]|tara:strand:+ start:1575 stop:2423 length:849 start_codon:yes stop_codon:yes gene_type:complete